MVTEKNKNENTEKSTQENIKELWADIIMDNVRLAENRIEGLYDLLHKLIENPFHVRDIDRLLQFSMKFKHKIELPYYLSMIIFEDKVEITGIEWKGSVLYFDYAVNGIDNYRYSVDLGANKLISKEYILLKYIFENINDNDFAELSDIISDIIVNVDNERKCVLRILENGKVKMAN